MFFFDVSVSEASEDVELHIKAAYLLNFARFIEWPRSSAEALDHPVVIAVLGHDSITAALATTVQGKNIKGRPINVREFASLDRIGSCDILFIPRSEAKRLRSVLADLSGKPILTVGEGSGFMGQGGIIEFQLIDDTLRFSINVGPADRSGLKISSELLRVAYSVTGRHK
jgi:hypothetical protein